MFLYEAKNFLRDISMMFGPLGAIKFTKESKASHLGKEAVRWAECNFGNSDRLTKFLRGHHSWIDHVIRMRNAVEHPGGNAGRLDIENFKPVGNTVQRPTWHLNWEVTYHNEEKITVTSSRWPRAFDPQNAERHRVS